MYIWCILFFQLWTNWIQNQSQHGWWWRTEVRRVFSWVNNVDSLTAFLCVDKVTAGLKPLLWLRTEQRKWPQRTDGDRWKQMMLMAPLQGLNVPLSHSEKSRGKEFERILTRWGFVGRRDGLVVILSNPSFSFSCAPSLLLENQPANRQWSNMRSSSPWRSHYSGCIEMDASRWKMDSKEQSERSLSKLKRRRFIIFSWWGLRKIILLEINFKSNLLPTTNGPRREENNRDRWKKPIISLF